MPAYVRPPIPKLVFRDEFGEVIHYGERWGGNQPPDWAYSKDEHPERFAPLVGLAEALIAYLHETYLVDVVEDETKPLPPHTARRVRVVPADPNATPLDFTFTTYPIVTVDAGFGAEYGWFCGCDACDESVEAWVEEIEKAVFSIIAGGLSEFTTIEEDGDVFVRHELKDTDGEFWQGGGTSLDFASEDVKAKLERLPITWAAWELR
ncbi:hypothetical protein BH09ACT10_BH09ACT10_06490 [soil metagenome]